MTRSTTTHDLSTAAVQVKIKCTVCLNSETFDLKYTIIHDTDDDNGAVTVGLRQDLETRPTDYGYSEFSYGLAEPSPGTGADVAHVVCPTCAAGLVADVEAVLDARRP